MKSILIFLSLTLMSTNAFALSCHGTGPFWGATLTNESIKVTYLETDILPVSSVEAVTGAPAFKVYKNDNQTLAVVTPNKCNNGMSDHIYPNEIIIFTDSANLYGCCGEGVLEDN